MQPDHVLKKLNFDLLNPPLGSEEGGGGGVGRQKYLLPCCIDHLTDLVNALLNINCKY